MIRCALAARGRVAAWQHARSAYWGSVGMRGVLSRVKGEAGEGAFVPKQRATQPCGAAPRALCDTDRGPCVVAVARRAGQEFARVAGWSSRTPSCEIRAGHQQAPWHHLPASGTPPSAETIRYNKVQRSSGDQTRRTRKMTRPYPLPSHQNKKRGCLQATTKARQPKPMQPHTQHLRRAADEGSTKTPQPRQRDPPRPPWRPSSSPGRRPSPAT